MPNLQIVGSNPHQALLDDFGSLDRRTPEAPLAAIKFKQDPVAAACASYRIWTESPANRWSDLEYVQVTQEDIERAEQLKKYYREKLVMESLTSMRNVNRSEFRRKLAQLVVNELVYTKRELGLLYRLPYFYQEDLDLDAIVAETDCKLVTDVLGAKDVHEYGLAPLRQVLRSRASGDYYHYWFRDTTYNHPHNLVVRHDNPLRSLIDGLFKQTRIHINGLLFVKSFRGYHQSKHFYQIGNMELS